MECYEMMSKLKEHAGCELSKSKERINAKDLGEVIDMIKDLADAEEKEAEKKYYEAITKAMKESEYCVDYDVNGKLGYQNRMQTGKTSMMMNPNYMPEKYDANDNMRMSDMSSGRMGTSNYGVNQMSPEMRMNNTRRTPMSGSKYGYSHDKYMEERKNYSTDSQEDKEKRKRLLNEYLDDFMESAKEMVEDMTQEERQMWKIKLNRIVNM